MLVRPESLRLFVVEKAILTRSVRATCAVVLESPKRCLIRTCDLHPYAGRTIKGGERSTHTSRSCDDLERVVRRRRELANERDRQRTRECGCFPTVQHI